MPFDFSITLTNCLRGSVHLNKPIFLVRKYCTSFLWLVVGFPFPGARFPGTRDSRKFFIPRIPGENGNSKIREKL